VSLNEGVSLDSLVNPMLAAGLAANEAEASHVGEHARDADPATKDGHSARAQHERMCVARGA